MKARDLQLSRFQGLLRVLLLLPVLSIPLVKAAPDTPIVLWPGGAPGALGSEPVDIPILTPYLSSKEGMSGAAIIICPGGGCTHLAHHHGRPAAPRPHPPPGAALVL